MRSFVKWILVALVSIMVALAVLYAASPAIVAKVAPLLAEGYGLGELELQIARPHWRRLTIHKVSLATDDLRIDGAGGLAEYSLRELLTGRLTRLSFDALDITVSSSGPAPPSGTTQTFEPGLFTPPVGRLSVAALRIVFADTGFVGVGSADLGDGVLSFALDGVAPEAASRLSLSATLNRVGEFNARFAEQGAAGAEYLDARGRIAETAVDLVAQFNLHGFALALASEIAGVPAGSGSLVAEVRTTLPWPLPDAGSWPPVTVSIPAFSVDWRSSDGAMQLQGVKGAATIAGRDVTGVLSGTILQTDDTRSVSVTFPERYAFELVDGVLSGRAGLRLRARQADSDVRTSLRSFTVAFGPAARIDFDADVDFTTTAGLETIGIEGRVTGRAVREREQPLRLAGRVDFAGKVDAAGQRRDGAVKARYVLDADGLDVDGRITSGIFDNVPFSLDYHLQTGAGQFAADKLLVFDKALAATVVPGWDRPYDLEAGRIDASLNLSWRTPEEIAAHLVLALDKGRAHYEDTIATDIAALLSLRANNAAAFESWRLEPTRVNVRRIDIGLPVRDLRMGVSWAADTLQVDDLQASVLGGRIYAGEFAYAIEAGKANFPLRLEDIDLAEVLALEGDDIVGTGKLDGILPIVISGDQPSIEGGRVAAQPPGGSIRLTSSFAGPTGQPGLDFALVALKDFRYSALRAEVDYAENGDLTLAVHLRGHNPAVEKGRAIVYNLNISENIPVLLESLQLQKKLGDKIEKGVKK